MCHFIISCSHDQFLDCLNEAFHVWQQFIAVLVILVQKALNEGDDFATDSFQRSRRRENVLYV
jgi:hypothetical protein